MLYGYPPFFSNAGQGAGRDSLVRLSINFVSFVVKQLFSLLANCSFFLTLGFLRTLHIEVERTYWKNVLLL
jgi:hypothetical protein